MQLQALILDQYHLTTPLLQEKIEFLRELEFMPLLH